MNPLIDKIEKQIKIELEKAKETEVTIPVETAKVAEVAVDAPKKKGKKGKKAQRAKAAAKPGAKKVAKSGEQVDYDIEYFRVGDEVKVYFKIIEGEKERKQIFQGTVIAKKHGGLRETLTVRRIVEGEGVERIFPLYSPKVMRLEVVRRGRVRRAKLYYLRDRVGKARRVKELLGEPAQKIKRWEAARKDKIETKKTMIIEQLIAARDAKEAQEKANAESATEEEKT